MTGNRHEPISAPGRAFCWLALAAVLLAGCVGGGPVIRQAGPTPPDPPPLPLRKPWAQLATQTPDPAPARQPVTAVVAAAPAPVPAPAPAVSAATIVGYSVRPGDTVFGIGRRLSVPLRSIIDANSLQPPYTLRTGQTLRIPNPRKHVVSKGDTVYGIARRYQVNLTELVRLNHVPAPFTISPGQDLILPVPMRTQTRIAAVSRPAGTPPPVPAAAVTVDTQPVIAPATATGSKSLSPATQTAALRPPPVPVAATPGPTAIPVPPPRSGSTFLWPVRGKIMTSFGPGTGGLHNDGINIAAPRGTPVSAADNGVVAYVGNELRGFGNLVLIKHADGWVTAYAHNDKLLVRRGEKVARGQAIAQVGSSGNVAHPQLHFEIRKGTRAVDPTRLLDRQSAALAE
jgi:murein DD-endopeptidase MepM/ murein hydrolase activator NlpD